MHPSTPVEVFRAYYPLIPQSYEIGIAVNRAARGLVVKLSGGNPLFVANDLAARLGEDVFLGVVRSRSSMNKAYMGATISYLRNP